MPGYGDSVVFEVETSPWIRHMVGVKRHVRDLAFVGVENAMTYAKDMMAHRIFRDDPRSGKTWTLYFGNKGDEDRPKVTWTASAPGNVDDPEAPAWFHKEAESAEVDLDYPSIHDEFEAGAEFLPGHIWIVGWVRNDAPHAGIIEYGGMAGWGYIMPRHYMGYVMNAPHHVNRMIQMIGTALGRYRERMMK